MSKDALGNYLKLGDRVAWSTHGGLRFGRIIRSDTTHNYVETVNANNRVRRCRGDSVVRIVEPRR